MPAQEREHVLSVKRGDVRELGRVLRDIANVQAQTQGLLDSGKTPLPTEPDITTLSARCTAAPRRDWNGG